MVNKQFGYIIEHMEDSISGWPLLEYKNMIKHIGINNFYLTHLNLKTNFPEELKNAHIDDKSVEFWPSEVQKRIILLDPSSDIELQPKDAENFDFLLFGGILGDDPPQDRTRLLRRLGFDTRNLGPVQMTTDTAVLVARQVLEFQKPLNSLEFIDKPEIRLGKKDTVELPFRYLVKDGHPVLPDGLLDHLKNEEMF
jgi:ribosome biogenesis SPOUT family RNA methylase Rps3